MKILMLVNWYTSCGKSIQTIKQAPDVNVPGQPYWFFKHWPERADVDVIDCSPIPIWHWLERRKLKFYVWQTIKAWFKLKDYDLIISHGAQSGVLLAFMRTILKSKMPPHIIIDVGCFNGGRHNPFELAPLKVASKSLAGVITHASRQAAYYQHCLPKLKDKNRFVPFGTDPEFFQPLDLPEENYTVCVGYVKRDWETLLAAQRRLQSETTLKMVGGAGKIHLPVRPQAPEKIECLPYVPINVLKEIIARAKLVILPLPYLPYAFGQMTLLQSMSMGKAVIVTNVPGVSDYVEDERTALLVRPYDPYELAEKIDFLLSHPERREELGRAARQAVVEKFNEKKMAEGIHRSCCELIGN